MSDPSANHSQPISAPAAGIGGDSTSGSGAASTRPGAAPGVDTPAPARSPSQRVELPAAGEDRLRIWGLLVLCALAVLPALLVGLDEADTTYTMEKIALCSSQETWLRQHGAFEPLVGGGKWEWLVPSWNGRPRVEKPPLTVWLNMAAWLSLSPEHATAQQLVLYARWMAVGMAMVTLLSTFWAGLSIGNLRTAGLAMVVTATCMVFIRFMRMASYDTHLAAFVTLGIASGLWAMRPLKEVNWTQRRVLGWFIAGLAMAAAFMTKGLVAAPLMLVPLAAAIAITPRRRLGNAIGLVFALLLGVLLAMPWFVYVVHYAERLGFASADEAFAEVFREYVLAKPVDHGQAEGQPFWYYLGLFPLAFPWTVWLIGALFQPWLRARGERRRQLLIAWLWFVGVLVVLSIPGAKQQRYLMPILPAVGLLVAQLWSWHIDLASRGQRDAGSWVLWLAHWLILFAASVGVPLFITMQDYLVARGTLDQYEVVGLPLWLIAAWGVGLAVIALEGARLHWKWHPRSAAVASTIWIVLMSTVFLWGYVRSHHGTNEYRAPAEKVARTVGDAPLFYLCLDREVDKEPNEEFLFYARRIVPAIAPAKVAEQMRRDQPRNAMFSLEQAAEQNQPVYVMARIDPTNRAVMEQHGFERLFAFDDGTVSEQRLVYRSPAAGTHRNTAP